MRIFLIGMLLLLVGFVGLIYYFVGMPGRSYSDPLPELSPTLINRRDRLHNDVFYLAKRIGERHHRRPGSLEQTAAFLERRFKELGCAVRIQTYGKGNPAPFKNIEVEIRGSRFPDEIVLIGAHYDTVPGSPGADDNATGVAALLELAWEFCRRPLPKTLRLVAFVNEEEPFATTEEMGSLVYARAARERKENITAMLSLESIGFYRDTPGSQHYPPPFSWIYPDTGSFLAFVGNANSRQLVWQAIASFRRCAPFPSEGVAAPESLAKDIARSDHASFWRYGYPALMITDTVPFRNPHYHTEEDTLETLDIDRLARVVQGLQKVVEDLAQ